MKIKSLLIILIVLFILPKLVYAETLREKKIGNYWYLVNENGEFQTGFQHLERGNRIVYYDSNGRMKYGQQKIDGYWYLFDKSDGNMLTGFQNIPEQNKIVYYNSEGQMQYNFQNIDGSIYYFDTKTGAKAVGIVKIDDKYYYFDTNGKLVTKAGEIKFNGYWYLLNEEGIAQTGFQHLEKGNRTVYYDSNGRMKYGQQKIDGYWYLFDKSDGNMLTGFQSIPEQNKIVYYNSKGQMQYNFQNIDGSIYYFDTKTGAKAVGIVKIDDKYYYFDTNGKLVTKAGEIKFNGYWYLLNEEGIAQTGFQHFEKENRTVYYDSNGRMKYGQQKIDGYWYLFDKTDGNMLTGFQNIPEQNKIVYYNSEGQMQYNFQNIDGSIYYFDIKTGAKAVGIVKIDDKYYYFDTNGKLVTKAGEIKFNGYWYLLNEEGIAQTGFQHLEKGNRTVYYDSNGRMKYGQQKINGYWYLFDKSDGNMLTGFQSIPEQNKIVYYNSEGQMQYGNQTIDNHKYYFDIKTGAMKSNFVYKDGKTYYYFEDGTKAIGWVHIAGTKYFFNSLGDMIGKNVKKVIDVSAYEKDIDWDTVKSKGDIDGVIIRISASAIKEDTKLARNISEVKRLHIPYGVYIYSYAEDYNEGEIYAEFAVKMIKKYSMNPTLGIYFDLEKNKITDKLGTKEYTEIVKGFMNVMNKNGYSKLAKIYTYTNYANTALNTEYLRNQIDWIAHYNNYTTYKGKYNMWQYTSTAQIPGISGNVDVSVKFN